MTVTAPRHRERWGKCLGAHDSQREDWPGWVGVRPLCTPPFYRWMKAPAWSWGPRSGCRTQCMSTWKTKADRRRWAGRKHVLSTDPTGLLASVSGTWPWPLTQSSWDTAPASPEHTCVLPGWLLLMLHFNNCLPLPLQLPVPGTLRRQQVTLTRTDGVGVGTWPLSTCCPSITPSGLPTAQRDSLWTDLTEHKAVFLPRFSAQTWSWALSPQMRNWQHT